MEVNCTECGAVILTDEHEGSDTSPLKCPNCDHIQTEVDPNADTAVIELFPGDKNENE